MPRGESAPSNADTGIRRNRSGSVTAKIIALAEDRNWFLGVNWVTKAHRARVSDAHGCKPGERSYPHGIAGLAEMADWILDLTGAAPVMVHVAIEVPHGPIVESLMGHGLRVHAINPKQLDHFRDRFSPAGAKNGSRDAELRCRPMRYAPALTPFAAWRPLIWS